MFGTSAKDACALWRIISIGVSGQIRRAAETIRASRHGLEKYFSVPTNWLDRVTNAVVRLK